MERLRTLNQRLFRQGASSQSLSSALDAQFHADVSAFRHRRQWLENLLALWLYLAYITLAQIIGPDRAGIAFWLRFGIAIPLLLAVNIALWFRLRPHLRESAILVASCATASVEVFLHQSHSPGNFAVHFGIVTMLVFTNTVMRLRLPFAIAGFGWAMGAEFLVLFNLGDRFARNEWFRAAAVLAVGLLTLIGNYSQNQQARWAFLRYAQKEALIGSLALSNKHLATVALTDSLTGLANRACLDKHLAAIWSQPSFAAGECSIVMVDIDRFKDLNDRYGHLYGDRVIKRVAHLLSEALRGADDFIARYGGEEFLVLLPSTSPRLAVIVAERLRSLVELAGLPSLRTDDPNLDGMRATVSCGVAGGSPQLYAEPYMLIGQADQALYCAKRDGRNRVRTWEGNVEASVDSPSAKDVGTLRVPGSVASKAS
jgi:diguanylate cyclase (GGDEF)-like protein